MLGARSSIMNLNLNHAFGFLLVGTVFGLLPRFAPGWCPATGVDGSSAGAIWLQVMSALLIGVALFHCGARVLSVVASMMEYDPARRAVRPVRVRPAMVARVRAAKILPMPASLRGGLLEQRPAA
jgi:hypothetical protein